MLAENKRINSKSQLRDWLKYECHKYGSAGILTALLNIFPVRECDVLRKHQIMLRRTEFYVNTGSKILSLLYRIRLNRFQNKYAIHVPINTCGRGLKIMHVGPILINGRATVGEDCSFHINTALVAGGRDDGVPTLGNGVILGIGAVVVGKVQVACNVVVGANAVINKDILENDIAVAGVPAHKISNNGRLTWNNNGKTLNKKE